jgi:4-amino-4-deoxy-L-arabinose transferase-like glycosyltransferase
MQKKILTVFILIILTASLLSHLGYLGLRAEEPRRAIVSIETYENGNLIVPTIHEETYYNKPPLYNWIIALFYFIFQSFDEWVVRLPGILFFLITSILIYQASKKHLGQTTAIFASLFYLTSADLLFYGTINTGEIDLFYSFIITWQALIIFKYFHEKKYLTMYLLSYTLTFIGLITKGIPSLAFQALTILALLLYYRKWKLLFGWQHILSIILLTMLTGIFLYLYSKNGNVQGFIAQQFAESSDKSFNEGTARTIFGMIIKFPIQFLSIALPWTLLIPLVFLKEVRAKIKDNKLVVFSIIFILSNIIIYWISPGIRNRYLYMFIPFLSIILAFVFTNLTKNANSNLILNKKVPLIGITLSIIAILVFPFFTKVSQHTEQKWLIIPLFVFVLLFLLFALYRTKNYSILYFVLAIVIGRLWFNFAVLPYLESRSNGNFYKSHIENINNITNKKKVYWTGSSITYQPDLKLFGLDINDVKYTIPPHLPYGIPYYQYLESGFLLSYDSVLKKGNYYLAIDTLIKQPEIDTLYQFNEKWKGNSLVLFALKD